MCEFKTGDEVLVYDGDDGAVKIYLYTRKDGRHMCQRRENWESSAAAMMPYKIIKPAPRYETRVLGPVAMMQRLVDEGYSPDQCGDWNNGRLSFSRERWRFCGGKPDKRYSWLDSWLEKVEVKP